MMAEITQQLEKQLIDFANGTWDRNTEHELMKALVCISKPFQFMP
jgi:hypothetical protein